MICNTSDNRTLFRVCFVIFKLKKGEYYKKNITNTDTALTKN